MNEKLVKYIETNILPKYKSGSGHDLDHIKYVIRRSLEFAKQAPEADPNICYTVAAYHDIGRLIDAGLHEKISAAVVRIDPNLKEFFTDEEIETIAEAVEDHRASSKHEPRSVYGRIVSSADRNNSVDETVKRAVECSQGKDEDERIEEARQHVLEKYGKNGYALSKMYFEDPEFEKACENIAKIASDFDTFKRKYESLK